MTDREKALKFRVNGATYAAIAAALGCSQGKAYSLVKSDRQPAEPLPPTRQARIHLAHETLAKLPAYRAPGRGRRSQRGKILDAALELISTWHSREELRPGKELRPWVPCELLDVARRRVIEIHGKGHSFPRVLGWAVAEVLKEDLR